MAIGTVGLIPARLQSTRLPRKLLLAETGKPLIQHTWEAASRAESLEAVVVATDSPEIAATVRGFGGRCELTGEHPSGTDRIAEVVRRCFPDVRLVVNIQGDEPEIDPGRIDLLVETLSNAPDAEMATLATPIRFRRELDDPSCTKVVVSSDGRALYFSRSPIPYLRDSDTDEVLRAVREHGAEPVWLLHLGIYAYRREALLRLTSLPVSRLERWEGLEQLRALECGMTIRVAVAEHRSVGIDTPDDYARFVQRYRSRVA